MKRALALTVLLVACSRKEAAPPPPPAPAAKPVAPKLRAQDLDPHLRELGTGGAITEVVIDLATPAFTKDDVGKPAAAGTVLRIDPPVPGALLVTQIWQLTFKPA